MSKDIGLTRDGQQFLVGFKKIPGGDKMFAGGLPPPGFDIPISSLGGGGLKGHFTHKAEGP